MFSTLFNTPSFFRDAQLLANAILQDDWDSADKIIDRHSGKIARVKIPEIPAAEPERLRVLKNIRLFQCLTFLDRAVSRPTFKGLQSSISDHSHPEVDISLIPKAFYHAAKQIEFSERYYALINAAIDNFDQNFSNDLEKRFSKWPTLTLEERHYLLSDYVRSNLYALEATNKRNTEENLVSLFSRRAGLFVKIEPITKEEIIHAHANKYACVMGLEFVEKGEPFTAIVLLGNSISKMIDLHVIEKDDAELKEDQAFLSMLYNTCEAFSLNGIHCNNSPHATPFNKAIVQNFAFRIIENYTLEQSAISGALIRHEIGNFLTRLSVSIV